MKGLFIEYPRCSTCQKSKKWLETNGIEFQDRNIIEETPTAEELSDWIQRSGLGIKKFFNTAGLKYKAFHLKEKLLTLTPEEQIKILASDGMLIKRPLWISDDVILVGFREKEWEEKLKMGGNE